MDIMSKGRRREVDGHEGRLARDLGSAGGSERVSDLPREER